MMSYSKAEQSLCMGLLLMKNSVLMTIRDALYYVLTLENRIHWNGYTNICVSHAKQRLCFSGKQWSSFLERRKEILSIHKADSENDYACHKACSYKAWRGLQASAPSFPLPSNHLISLTAVTCQKLPLAAPTTVPWPRERCTFCTIWSLKAKSWRSSSGWGLLVSALCLCVAEVHGPRVCCSWNLPVMNPPLPMSALCGSSELASHLCHREGITALYLPAWMGSARPGHSQASPGISPSLLLPFSLLSLCTKSAHKQCLPPQFYVQRKLLNHFWKINKFLLWGILKYIAC